MKKTATTPKPATIAEAIAEENEEWECGAIQMEDEITEEKRKRAETECEAWEAADTKMWEVFNRMQARKKQEWDELETHL